MSDTCPECGSNQRNHRGLMPSMEEWCCNVECQNDWHGDLLPDDEQRDTDTMRGMVSLSKVNSVLNRHVNVAVANNIMEELEQK